MEQWTSHGFTGLMFRKPVVLLKCGEYPGQALPGHALLDMRVFSDLVVIVHGEEVVVANTVVGDGSGEHEDDAAGGNLPGLVGWGGDGGVFAGLRALCLGFALAGFACHGRQSPMT